MKMEQQKKIQLLYLDDEPNNLVSFTANFRTFCNVYTATTAEEGRQILKEKNIHVIVTDQRMPNITGIEFLESIIADHPEPIRILLTGYSDIEAVVGAINKGQVYRYLMKPLNVEELKMILEDAYNLYLFRKRNKDLLDKYKKIFEESSDAIFVIDETAKLIDFNQATVDLLKYSRSQLQNLTHKDLLEDQHELEIIIHELSNDRTIKNLEIKLLDSAANKLDCLLSINPIYDKNGMKIGYQGIVKDITKQKKAQNMLLRTILNSQEKERNEFATDLHDSISQQLASITFYIQTIENIDLSKKSTSQTLAEANASLNSVLNEIRDLCYKIIPRTIINFGLIESIKDLCYRIGLRKDIKFNFDVDEPFQPLDKALEITIFRVIQELIDNAIEHGKATKINIKINRIGNNVVISFQDNGTGFNVKNFHEYKGVGLKNIKLRVESHNGEINIQSSISLGTSCRITIPIAILN